MKKNIHGGYMSPDEAVADLMTIDLDIEVVDFVSNYFETRTGQFDHTTFVMFEQVLKQKYGLMDDSNPHKVADIIQIVLDRYVEALKLKYHDQLVEYEASFAKV